MFSDCQRTRSADRKKNSFPPLTQIPCLSEMNSMFVLLEMTKTVFECADFIFLPK